jgi:hypothetical protein
MSFCSTSRPQNQTQVEHQSATQFIQMTVIYLVVPKAAAKQASLLNKLVSKGGRGWFVEHLSPA